MFARQAWGINDRDASTGRSLGALALRVVLLLMAGALGVEAATIRGRVFSEADSLYLEGARVELVGTGQVVFTARGGEYRLANVAPGSYTVRVRYAGLPTLTEEIEITRPDATVTLNPTFRTGTDEVIQLEELVVQGTILGSAKAIAQERAADNLLNVVASDAFGQFTDRNPAEALQRLPGVTVQESQGEGQFVIIRGADPRLNSVAIDGVFAATPQEDGRSTALNIISIDQLESIEVTKSWLPDQWANFIGGSVNLITRSALDRDRRFASFEAAYGRHEIADDESFRLNAVYGDVFRFGENQRLGFQLSADLSEDNRGSETLDVDRYTTEIPWEISNMPNGLNMQGFDLEDYEITRERTGLSAKLEYRLNDDHEWSASFSRNEFDDDEVLQQTSFSVATNNYGGDRFLTNEIARELGYDLNDPEVRRRIDTATPDKRLRAEEAFALGDMAYDEATRTYTFQKFGARSTKRWESRLTEDRITTWQLEGDHRFLDRFHLDYQYYQSGADQARVTDGIRFNAPRRNSESGLTGNRPFIRVDGDAFADPAVYVATADGLGLSRTFTRSEDERTGYSVNVAVDYGLGNFRLESKIGFAADDRDKLYDVDDESFSRIGAGSPRQLLTLADAEFLGGFDNRFISNAGDYVFGARFDTPSLRRFVADPSTVVPVAQSEGDLTTSIINDILRPYDATEDTTAWYFLQSVEWKQWKLLAGFRHEETENRFVNFALITRPEEPIGALNFIQPVHWRLIVDRIGREAILTETTFAREYDHTLPAVHLIRRLGENTVVRAAYTGTIKRPTFTDLIPREIPGIDGSSFATNIRLPNLDLRPLESRNFDLSLDHYFTGLGAVGFSFFYKDLDGPVYEERRVIEPGDDGWEALSIQFDSAYRVRPDGTVQSNNLTFDTSQIVNAGEGELFGFELYVQRDLSFMPEPFTHFGVSANYSRIDSEVDLLRPERNFIRGGDGAVVDLDPSVPLFQQPDELGNISVYYERGGFLARLSYNYRGRALRNVVAAETTIRDLVTQIDLGPDALDTYDGARGRFDLFVQYTWREQVTFFFEGTNITNEPAERYYGDETRLAWVQYTEPVYFLGLQWKH